MRIFVKVFFEQRGLHLRGDLRIAQRSDDSFACVLCMLGRFTRLNRLAGRWRSWVVLSESRSPSYRKPDNGDGEDYFVHSGIAFHAMTLFNSDPSLPRIFSQTPHRFRLCLDSSLYDL